MYVCIYPKRFFSVRGTERVYPMHEFGKSSLGHTFDHTGEVRLRFLFIDSNYVDLYDLHWL